METTREQVLRLSNRDGTMTQSFRTRLNRGDTLLGSLVTLATAESAELMALAGCDWLFLDFEHGGPDLSLAQRMIQAIADRSHPVVRIPAHDEIWIKKCLDFGAAGIITPHVNTRDEAENIVRLSKYAPRGCRGVGAGRAHQYGIRFEEYLREANDSTAVVVQIEHPTAVENVESILAVNGLDAVFVGPYDLSTALGLPGQVTHPLVMEHISRVVEAARRFNKPAGIFGVSAEEVKPYLLQGFTLIAAGVDTTFLLNGVKKTLEKLRTA